MTNNDGSIYIPKSLMVTGAAGFIGANFVRYWLERHPDSVVVVVDLLTYAGRIENLEGLDEYKGYRFVKGDICDEKLVSSVIKEFEIDTVVHFAAESHVDRSITGPDEFIRTNIIGTHTLLKAAKKIWIDEGSCRDGHRFHHVSTDEVYGTLEPEDPPFSEQHQYLPNSPYAASKASSDHLVRAYHHTYGLNVTISNCSNNYGPYQFPEKLIPLSIINVLHGREIPIYGDGSQVRDWLYVDDHARAIENVIKSGKIGEVYNIGGNNEWKNIDIVTLICKKIDEFFRLDNDLCLKYPQCPAANKVATEALITYVADRPGHDRRYAIDPSKSKMELGYDPIETFESGIDKTVRWYLTSDEWWSGLL